MMMYVIYCDNSKSQSVVYRQYSIANHVVEDIVTAFKVAHHFPTESPPTWEEASIFHRRCAEDSPESVEPDATKLNARRLPWNLQKAKLAMDIRKNMWRGAGRMASISRH